MIKVIVLETSLTDDHKHIKVIFGELGGTRTWEKAYRRSELPEWKIGALYSYHFHLYEHEEGDFDVIF